MCFISIMLFFVFKREQVDFIAPKSKLDPLAEGGPAAILHAVSVCVGSTVTCSSVGRAFAR